MNERSMNKKKDDTRYRMNMLKQNTYKSKMTRLTYITKLKETAGIYRKGKLNSYQCKGKIKLWEIYIEELF